MRRLDRLPASGRLALSVLAGLIAAGALPWSWDWQTRMSIGWIVFCVVKVAWLIPMLRADHHAARTIATRPDETQRIASAVSLAACVMSLASVAITLHKANAEQDGYAAVLTTLAVTTVIASWFLVHLEYMARYTREYFAHGDGINFPSAAPTRHQPTYVDFLYVALTVGMTFQVSDTDITTASMRTLVIRHSLLSYLFGAVIIAVTINTVAGIVGGGT